MPEELTVRAIFANQNGNVPLYSFYLKGNEVLEVADISRIRRGDAEEVMLNWIEPRDLSGHVVTKPFAVSIGAA